MIDSEQTIDEIMKRIEGIFDRMQSRMDEVTKDFKELLSDVENVEKRLIAIYGEKK